MRSALFRPFLSILLAMVLAIASSVVLSTPAHAAESPIQQRYDSDAALRTLLGPSTGVDKSVAGGLMHWYKWGTLYWSPSTGVREVHGAIRHRYHQLGGPAGFLGFPVSDEGRIHIKYDIPEQQLGARSDFQNGAITWTSSLGAKWIGKAIANVLPYHTFPDWGIPHKDEKAAREGRVVDIGDGLIYSTLAGVIPLTSGYPSGIDGIVAKYRALGAHTGFLKLPVVSPSPSPIPVDEGRLQDFQGGRIYQCGFMLGECANEAYEVHGAILWHFDHHGGLARFGFPVSDEQSTPGGRVSLFQKGSIFWDAATSKVTATIY